MESYWDVIKRIVKESDLVLEILDARLVELSRNDKVEEIIRESGRPFIFVVNKSDLVSKKGLKNQIDKLSKMGEVVFVSAKDRRSMRILYTAIKKVFKEYGKREKTVRKYGDPKLKYREAKGDIVVGVLGYPNSGKSSLINALAHKKKVKVSKKSGTTHGIHWVKATNEIKLIDSPGVIPLARGDEVRYGLIGAKDTERLKNPELVSDAVINLFLENNKKNFEDFYGIEIEEGDDVNDITEMIGRKKGFVMKGDNVDEHRTAGVVVRDWQQGRLKL
jgi:ribosome biogenesis GTPase A